MVLIDRCLQWTFVSGSSVSGEVGLDQGPEEIEFWHF